MTPTARTPSRPCSQPRCPNLQPCPTEGHQRKPFANAQRTGAVFYQTQRWRRERAVYLAAHPNCRGYSAGVSANGNAAPCRARATTVDHIQPHRGDYERFWDAAGNWQSLCTACHQRKTGRETRARAGAKA